MTPVHMPPSMEPQVRALFRACHPGWDNPAPFWFFAYPTLVLIEDEKVVAYASYSMNTSDDGVLMIYLQDTGVAEHARGRGLARMLMNKRIAIGRSMGATFAGGMTQPDNKPMLEMLRSMNFHEVATVPSIYTNMRPHQDGVLFLMNLTERT